MTVLHIFWSAVKGFLGWLLFTVIFIMAATFTGGFKAYCPLISFFFGALAVFIVVLVVGIVLGVWKE